MEDKTVFRQKFESSSKQVGNQSFYSKIIKISQNGNSVNFPYLSYAINSRNEMYKASSDIKFLEENFTIITNIIKAGFKSGNEFSSPRWKAISKDDKYKEVHDTEVILYEGYLFRYISEYCYIIDKASLTATNRKRLTINISILEAEFLKWYQYSLEKRNDDSYLQGIRTHMGSHWATVAMYLYLLSDNETNKEIYKNVYSRFDASLRKNLRKASVNGSVYYVWNSTWDFPFTNQQKERRDKGQDPETIQDVTHGNHVVQYIVDSYSLNTSDWTRQDVQLLSNTLRYKMWDAKRNKFSDLVNGTSTSDASLMGTGWKQSDGWMKLMKYDHSLTFLYTKFYENNKKDIDLSYLNNQFYAIFYASL